MKVAIAFIVSILGLALSLTNCLAVVKTILDGVHSSRVLMNLTAPDPSQLGAIIGETMIAVASHGFLAIVPATLLYVALVGFRIRKGWFYSCTKLAAVYFLFVLPFATAYGIILLVALRRRKSEFGSVTKTAAKASLL
ncbi:MAG: hypothetical protein WAW39_30500 [Prosthecobacter sp.]|jgi:hypothetical protein|uniref:hypothetical protein n=1 Tax=Prosthecobacter sp. TaxID=1965333 RepID=UPI003BB034F6